MACPFFVPTQKWEEGAWLHPSRLPLGGGWIGHCCAPGYEGAQPTDSELAELCNLGYASTCSRIPFQRSCDAVRFSVARDDGNRLLLWFVCEAAHLPVTHGTLEYTATAGWLALHPDAQIQRLAECYLQSYLARRGRHDLDNSSKNL